MADDQSISTTCTVDIISILPDQSRSVKEINTHDIFSGIQLSICIVDSNLSSVYNILSVGIAYSPSKIKILIFESSPLLCLP